MNNLDTLRPITHRQMKTVDVWVRSGFKSKAKALSEAGYGKSMVRHPDRIFKSPTVLNELEMRGYNIYGIRNEVQEIFSEEDESPKEEILIDFSKITKEQLQWLKEELTKGPNPLQFPSPRQIQEIPSYVPKGDGIDIFNATERPKYPDYRDFSSM